MEFDKLSIDKLKKLVSYHQDKYYNDESELSDAEYDMLYDTLADKLKSVGREKELLTDLGKDSSSNFPKVKHLMVMGSQNKASKPINFNNWMQKQDTLHFIVEYKMDGASIELQYNQGKFIAGVTRGNGYIGDDITSNVKQMKGLVQNLNNKFTGSIRGEVVLDHETFKNKYKDYSNCRNTANGIMKRKDGVGSSDLTIIVYDVFPTDGNTLFKNEIDKLVFLSNSKFNAVPYIITDPNNGFDSVFNTITDIRDNLNESRKVSYDFDIDGLVIKPVSFHLDDLSNIKPSTQIAYKFSLEIAETTLIDVEWSVSGNKRTPVAICNPVELCGTIVQRALLSNISLIRKMGLKIGSKILMVKRGEIIPKIESVVSTPNSSKDIQVPNTCEFCGNKLVISENNTFITCPNPKCPETLRFIIQTWVELHDIMHLGPASIRTIQDIGCQLYSITDLYNLTEEDMISKGFSSANTRKIISEIQKSRNIKLENFIAGFMPDGIGRTIVKSILKNTGISSIEEFVELQPEDLHNISGIGLSTINGIMIGIKLNNNEMLSLSKIMNFETNNFVSNKLTGLSFCITGALYLTPGLRNELSSIIKQHGGIHNDNITKLTNYLICNDTSSNSGKSAKAKALKIPIITEEEFYKMIK